MKSIDKTRGVWRQRLRSTQHDLSRLEAFLTRPRRSTVLLLVGACACAAVVHLLGCTFLSGAGAFWNAPRGSIGHGWADMATNLSGYRYFQLGRWRFPLLSIPDLGAPTGTTLAETDSIPLLALIARLLYEMTGVAPNLFGVWIAACLVGAALSLSLLVRLLGAQGIAASLAAGTLGFSMPALLFRWGHPALMAQCEITLALSLVVWRSKNPRAASAFWQTLLLLAAAFLTSAYLFVMVFGIVVAFYGQSLILRRAGRLRDGAECAAAAALLAVLLIVCGTLRHVTSLRAPGFGILSANLLGPILPQRSGIFPAMSHFVLDATGGQYEGFCYAGAGLLILLPALFDRQSIARALKAMPGVALFLAACTVFALSNRIYLGLWQVASIPFPAVLTSAADIMRASGRFVWPPLIAVLAAAIAAAARRRHGAAWLLIAALLQWIDTAPMRMTIAAQIAEPAAQPLAFQALRAAMAGKPAVIVLPSFACLPGPPGRSKAIALEAELAASIEAMPTNTVYEARPRTDCGAERRTGDIADPAGRALRIYLPEWPGFAAVAAAAGPSCAIAKELVLCGPAGQSVAFQKAVVPDPAWHAP